MAETAVILKHSLGIEARMKIGEILKQARERKGVAQESIISKIGITRAALSHIENGRHLPGYDLLNRLAEVYELDPASLLAQLDKERIERFVVRESIRHYRAEPAFLQFIFVPIIDTIPCGRAISITPKTLEDVDEYAPIPAEELANKTGLLGFRVAGESMNGKGIYEGDIIIIDPALEPINGDLVVISVNDEVTLKEYHHQSQTITLKSANPEFPDMTFPIDSSDIRTYGKVIKIMTLRDA